MSFGRELSHLVEEQISKAMVKNSAISQSGNGGQAKADGGRIAMLEANLQRLSEEFGKYISSQKKSRRNTVEYGLEVLALHGMRVAITAGRASFADQEEPINLPFSYLELSKGGLERQIRYIYLTDEGKIIESLTDPSNISESYIPLGMVDIWSNSQEIIQDRIQDIRPRGSEPSSTEKDSSGQLTGNVTLLSPDTGNDSFLVAGTEPASMKVKISSGRALVDGEVIDAEGGLLDLRNHRKVEKEFLGISDGSQKEYSFYHENVSEVLVYVDDLEAAATIEMETGEILFAEAPAEGAVISVSYTFSGNYRLVFLVEKIKDQTGKSIGVLNWKLGSNRTPAEPPKLEDYEHIIAKIDLSSGIEFITDELIDNAYEVSNLTQEDLQYGEKLGNLSLKDGAITANKIRANSISSNHIAAGSIDAAKIKSGAIQAQHIAVGAIQAQHIGAETITADMIKGGTISADKFEDSTWGDLTQAMRYVKSVLKGMNSWRKAFTKEELAIGEMENISYDTEEFPTLRLKYVRSWDEKEEIVFSDEDKIEVENIFDQIGRKYDLIVEPLFQEVEKFIINCGDEVKETIENELKIRDIRELKPQFDSRGFYSSRNDIEILERQLQFVLCSEEQIIQKPEEFKIKKASKEELNQALYLSSKNELYYKLTNIEEIFYGLRDAYIILYKLGVWENFAEQLSGKTEILFPNVNEVIFEMEEELQKLTKITFKALEVTKFVEGWDQGNWDFPVFESGFWESASIDYGKEEDLQAEFWVKPLLMSKAQDVKVKFRYSEDNVTWSDYENGSPEKALGYFYWIGTLRSFRYVKIRVELSTGDVNDYELLGYPEVRIASCQSGTVGDIRFPAMTVKQGELKMNGALLNRADYPVLWEWVAENQLVVSEESWNEGYQGSFSLGNGYSTFRLPDARGEFFRMVDDGRGVDPERSFGSSQGDAIRNIVGSFYARGPLYNGSSANGALYIHSREGQASNSSGVGVRIGFDASKVVPTANENRPRNLAYFACIRYE